MANNGNPYPTTVAATWEAGPSHEGRPADMAAEPFVTHCYGAGSAWYNLDRSPREFHAYMWTAENWAEWFRIGQEDEHGTH